MSTKPNRTRSKYTAAPTPVEVPASLRHKQFPFALAADASDEERRVVRDGIDAALRGVENAVFYHIRKIAHIMQDSDVDDIAQIVMLHLARGSLPRFNQQLARKTKLSTFLFFCARMKALEVVRKWRRPIAKEKRLTLDIDDRTPPYNQSPDDGGVVERFAEAVLANPESYMTDQQARAFAILDSTKMLKDISRQFGYKDATSLCMILNRTRERVKALFLESGGILSEVGPKGQRLLDAVVDKLPGLQPRRGHKLVRRRIEQVNPKTGGVVRTFANVTAAYSSEGYEAAFIRKAICKGGIYRGFKWQYAPLPAPSQNEKEAA